MTTALLPSGDPAVLRPHPRHQRAVQTRRRPPLPDRVSGALLTAAGLQVRELVVITSKIQVLVRLLCIHFLPTILKQLTWEYVIVINLIMSAW